VKENQEHIELEYSGNIDNTKNSEQLFIDYFDTNVGFPCGISVLGTSPAACGEI